MQHSPVRIGGPLVALGVMALSLVAGLACPGNLDPVFQQSGIGGSTGTGGGPAGNGGTEPPCDAQTLMQGKCGMAGCHVPGNSNAGTLDLLSPNSISRLLNVKSGGDPYSGALCGAGMNYLNPGTSPASGLLIDKLSEYPSCGDAMPNLGTWSVAQGQCVTDWANFYTKP